MTDPIKQVLHRQEDAIMKLQQKQDLKMAKLESKHATNLVKTLDKMFNDAMHDALKNGMTKEIADNIIDIQHSLDAAVHNEAVLYDRLEGLKEEAKENQGKIMQEFQKIELKGKEFSQKGKEFVQKGKDILLDNTREKTKTGLNALSNICNHVKDFSVNIKNQGISKANELSTICQEQVRAQYRAYLRSTIESDINAINKLDKLQEKLNNALDKGATISNRIKNAGRVLQGKEVEKVTKKEHSRINGFFSAVKENFKEEMEQGKKEYEQCMKSSVRAYHHSTALREKAGIDKAMAKTKEQQRNLVADRGKMTALDKKIQNAIDKCNMPEKESLQRDVEMEI